MRRRSFRFGMWAAFFVGAAVAIWRSRPRRPATEGPSADLRDPWPPVARIPASGAPTLEVLTDTVEVTDEGDVIETIDTIEVTDEGDVIETIDTIEVTDEGDVIEVIDTIGVTEDGDVIEVIDVIEVTEDGDVVEMIDIVEVTEDGDVVEIVEVIEEELVEAGGAEPPAVRWVVPSGPDLCPETHPVKAKLSSGLFHLPGMLAYTRTKPDRCYATEADAVADGLTRAKR